MTSSGMNGLNDISVGVGTFCHRTESDLLLFVIIRTHASPICDRTRCPEE